MPSFLKVKSDRPQCSRRTFDSNCESLCIKWFHLFTLPNRLPQERETIWTISGNDFDASCHGRSIQSLSRSKCFDCPKTYQSEQLGIDLTEAMLSRAWPSVAVTNAQFLVMLQVDLLPGCGELWLHWGPSSIVQSHHLSLYISHIYLCVVSNASCLYILSFGLFQDRYSLRAIFRSLFSLRP